MMQLEDVDPDFRTPPSRPTSSRCDGGIGYPCERTPIATLSRTFVSSVGDYEVSTIPRPICRECLDEVVRDDVPRLPNRDTRVVAYTVRGIES